MTQGSAKNRWRPIIVAVSSRGFPLRWRFWHMSPGSGAQRPHPCRSRFRYRYATSAASADGGQGTADLTWDPSTSVVTWSITYNGFSGPVTMAHFHGHAPRGKNGPVVIWLTQRGSPVASPIKGEATLTPQQANSSRSATGTSTYTQRIIRRARSAVR